MRVRMRLLKHRKEKDGLQVQKLNIQLRVKRTRKLDLIDLKVRRRIL